MSSEIDIAFNLNDPGKRLAHHSEAALYTSVIQAIAQAFHLPLAALIGSVFINITQTVMDIKLELDTLRIHHQIALRQVTGLLINNALLQLEGDDRWHPEVKSLLQQSLIDFLAAELRRAGR